MLENGKEEKGMAMGIVNGMTEEFMMGNGERIKCKEKEN